MQSCTIESAGCQGLLHREEQERDAEHAAKGSTQTEVSHYKNYPRSYRIIVPGMPNLAIGFTVHPAQSVVKEGTPCPPHLSGSLKSKNGQRED